MSVEGLEAAGLLDGGGFAEAWQRGAGEDGPELFFAAKTLVTGGEQVAKAGRSVFFPFEVFEKVDERVGVFVQGDEAADSGEIVRVGLLQGLSEEGVGLFWIVVFSGHERGEENSLSLGENIGVGS